MIKECVQGLLRPKKYKKMHKLFESKQISNKLRFRILKLIESYDILWNIDLHKILCDKIEAFEIFIWEEWEK